MTYMLTKAVDMICFEEVVSSLVDHELLSAEGKYRRNEELTIFRRSQLLSYLGRQLS